MRVVASCILIALVLGCSNSVAVVLAGPAELDGATILIDGVERATFRRTHGPGSKEGGVLAEIKVPLGNHRLEIRHPNVPPITQELNYAEGGEDYISIELPPKET